MFVVLDDRPSVAGGCVACFEREGIAAVAVEPAEFTEWFELISDADVAVVEGFLLGTVANRRQISARIRSRCRAPLIGLIEAKALSETLDLFSSGLRRCPRKTIPRQRDLGAQRCHPAAHEDGRAVRRHIGHPHLL